MDIPVFILLSSGSQCRLEEVHTLFQPVPPTLIGLRALGIRREGEPNATYLRRIHQDIQNFIPGSRMTILVNEEDVTNAYFADEPQAAVVALLEEPDPSRQLVVQIHLPDYIQPDPPRVLRLRARQASRRRRRRTVRRRRNVGNVEGPREGAISRALRRHLEPRVFDPTLNMQGNERMTRARKRAVEGRPIVRYFEDADWSDEESDVDNESNEDGTWEIVSSSVQVPENKDPEGTDNPDDGAGPSGSGNRPVDSDKSKHESTEKIEEDPHAQVEEEPHAQVDEEPHAQVEEEPHAQVEEEPAEVDDQAPPVVDEQPGEDIDEQPEADFGEEPPGNFEEEPPGLVQEQPTVSEERAANGDEPHAHVEYQPAEVVEQPGADVNKQPPGDFGVEPGNFEEEPPVLVQEQPTVDEDGADEPHAQVEYQPAEVVEQPPDFGVVPTVDEGGTSRTNGIPKASAEDAIDKAYNIYNEQGANRNIPGPSTSRADDDIAGPSCSQIENDIAGPSNSDLAERWNEEGGAEDGSLSEEASTPMKKKRKKRGGFRLTMPKKSSGKKNGQAKKRLPKSLRMNASGPPSDEEEEEEEEEEED